MNNNDNAALFKAISDEKRLKIVKMLSSGSLCACRILEHFNFSQPALSQHMKILVNCGLVVGKKEGSWMHYSINKKKLDEMIIMLDSLSKDIEKNCRGDYSVTPRK
jgi:ArsR family transcriptional regulator, arsenate/arsenite/antimonite-responsive transcriptional repressor